MIPKFRAWDKELQTMLDVSLIDFKKRVLVGEHWKFGETNFVNFDDIKLMQSTGLKDKNGKEIFEGDIVSVGTATRVVKKNNLLGFYIEEGEKIGYFSSVVDVNCLDLFAKDFGEEAEILGNIYKNKELLDA
jgi:hypothetical protein